MREKWRRKEKNKTEIETGTGQREDEETDRGNEYLRDGRHDQKKILKT